jgi:hypothetical protein
VKLISIYLDRHNKLCLDWARQHHCKPRERWAVREKLHDGTLQTLPTWDRVTFPTWSDARDAIIWLEKNPTKTYEDWLRSTKKAS